MFGLKETTVVIIFGMACVTALAVLRPDLITSDVVTWVFSSGIIGKAFQGGLDRFKPNTPFSNPDTRVKDGL